MPACCCGPASGYHGKQPVPGQGALSVCTPMADCCKISIPKASSKGVFLASRIGSNDSTFPFQTCLRDDQITASNISTLEDLINHNGSARYSPPLYILHLSFLC
jgi:hypothetical protein